MSEIDLREKVEKVLSGSQLAVLATLYEGKPWVRYVMTHAKGLTLYVTTFLGSRKVAQIKADPNVHVTLGGGSPEEERPYVQVAATADILTDSEIKREMWVDYLSQFFSGPEDPNYAVIRISPSLIELMEPGKMEPQVLEIS